MATPEEHLAIENDQYAKIHELTSKVGQLAGTVEAANKINQDLVMLLKRALLYMFITILFLIGAVIYGAIGKEGFYAVRQVVPTSAEALPWNDKQNAPHVEVENGGTK